MSDKLKRQRFIATIEPVLLYGAEAWTLTAAQEKGLDGCYTRMLRMAMNVSWEDHMRNVDLYAGLPSVSEKIRERRLRLAGHCVRHPELAASPLILWEPTHGTARRGRQTQTFVNMLKRDTSYSSAAELRS